MIKFFRKIRQKLLTENKFGKYLTYAIGEIVLVVIGILIALAINNWNQNRVKNSQEQNDLLNLKEELQTNILDFKNLDSLYSKFEQSTNDGLRLLDTNPKVENLKRIDSSIVTLLKVFPLTNSTYNEMLNTGRFYNLKNKMLNAKITQFYSEADNYSQAFIEINKEVLKMLNHPDLYIYDLLLNRLKTKPVNIQDIDTSWMNNVNSPTYLALYKKSNYIQDYSNKTRRDLITRQIIVCKELIILIDDELRKQKAI